MFVVFGLMCSADLCCRRMLGELPTKFDLEEFELIALDLAILLFICSILLGSWLRSGDDLIVLSYFVCDIPYVTQLKHRYYIEL